MSAKSLPVLKILFLEDFESDYELMLHSLKKSELNLSTLRVGDMPSFISALETFRPDCIIGDYLLPAYNGLEAYQDLRRLNEVVPFIMVTAHVRAGLEDKSIRLGINGFLNKNNFNQLPKIVLSVLEEQGKNKFRSF
jgi:CheY-like chemotaxis protein